MEIAKVMVVGAGQMGSGIAQVLAQAGKTVILQDVKQEYVKRGLQTITKNLTRDVQKRRKTEQEKQDILAQIMMATDLSHARDVQVVIEAIVENIDIKTKVFRQLDEHAPKETIFASNTSSLPITEIAAVTNRPEQVIGMHFMNPVAVMKLVEVIRGLETSDETFTTIQELAKVLNKVPVDVSDYPGFVSNRILLPMINEAIYCVYEGVASPEDIDQVMKLGMNHPMGPITLADFIGLDTCLSIMEVLHHGFGESKYRPCPLLRKYVKAGRLGRKTGRGFFVYES